MRWLRGTGSVVNALRQFCDSLFGTMDVADRLMDRNEEVARELHTTLLERQTDDVIARIARLSSTARSQADWKEQEQ